MCGIAGYAGVAPPELLPSMLRELKHRGPDDDGLHLEPGIGLGATRLAIIDLHTGHQPIANADESAWIVFNGEIRSEEHTSELQSPCNLVCRLLLEKKKTVS